MQAVAGAEQTHEGLPGQFANLIQQSILGRVDHGQIARGKIQHQQQDQIVIRTLDAQNVRVRAADGGVKIRSLKLVGGIMIEPRGNADLGGCGAGRWRAQYRIRKQE